MRHVREWMNAQTAERRDCRRVERRPTMRVTIRRFEAGARVGRRTRFWKLGLFARSVLGSRRAGAACRRATA